MGKLVYIMGKSGTGKSRSMKNIPADMLTVINPEGKDFPFGKTSPAFKATTVVIDKGDDIVDFMKTVRTPVLVIDDFQTVMTNEFMRRSNEIGYQKWTDIGKHAWEIANTAKELPENTIVYIMCHTETDDNGNEKIKTLGKLLDQNVVLESKATIVLKTGVEDEKYFFYTQNNGKDTVKSPEGMFPSYAVQNDLKYVDDAIRNYYDLPGARTDSEMAQEHAEMAQEAVKPSTGRKSRKKEEKPTEGTKEATAGTSAKRTREQVEADNQKKMADYMEAREKAVEAIADGREEIPFEEAAQAADSVPAPELEKVPRRTRADRSAQAEDDTLKEDTCFFVPATGDYLLKHAGDKVPEGGQVISREEYGEAVVKVAKGIQPQTASASATTGDPLAGAMNPPEQRTRRRRTRGEKHVREGR